MFPARQLNHFWNFTLVHAVFLVKKRRGVKIGAEIFLAQVERGDGYSMSYNVQV